MAVGLLAAACSSGTTTAQPDPTAAPTVEPGATPNETPAPNATPEPSSTPRPTVPVPVFIDENGFNDHSVPTIATSDEYFALSRQGVTNQSVVKFTIADMTNGPQVRWLDSNFFSLHDEWYWFRLLNGQPVPAVAVSPVQDGPTFESIAEVYEWAQALSPGDLPLDLRIVDSEVTGSSRLYSPNFYDVALNTEPRNYGLGSLVHVPSNDSAVAHWLIELEFTDDPTANDIASFFESLAATLPAEIGDNLEWVVRSPQQEQLAQLMADEGLPYNDRIVRFSEIVPPGQVGVYNEGIAAGRLLLIEEGGAQLSDAVDTDIVLVENVPDWLPPAAALISSAPQTPLAHVNLLARNRGIPNASQSGLLEDSGMRQAARVRAYAIVQAQGTEQLDVVLITRDEFREWQSLVSKNRIAVPEVDITSMPPMVDLGDIAPSISNEEDVDAWRPIIGGKAAGFLALLEAEGVTTPLSPLAITVAPYLEHLTLVDDALEAMLNDPTFQASARARFLLLEGQESYGDFYTTEADAEFAATFANDNPAGSLVGEVLAAGGFMELFRDTAMNEETLREITAALQDAYGDYAVTQGLRFRSSSSVEDIEGFSGAGLYDSNTGYFEPERLPDEGDHKRTIERAIKKTWASYWGFEAFEERELENVDHRSGAMAVLVHARFDDPLELNNGVATFTINPDNAADAALAIINVQRGAVSVTNPDPEAIELPEVIQVRLDNQGVTHLERTARSTIPGSGPVLADPDVTELVQQLAAVTELWRDRVNAALPASQRVQTVTLDFEFKTMAQGWPALDRGGADQPSRLVVKQARPLDPGLRGVAPEVLALPIPRDIVARARLIEEVDCGQGQPTIEILTDALSLPDMGYSETPLVLGDPASGATGSECERTTLLSTPEQYLFTQLAQGNRLDLSN